MNLTKRELREATRNRIIAVVGGVILNFLLSYLMFHFEIPLYMDSIGTIGVAFLCGSLPGMLVGVLTNCVCVFFNAYSIYYVLISILIAGVSAYVSKRNFLKRRIYIPLFVFVLAVISGGVGYLFQWSILGGPQYTDIYDAAQLMKDAFGIPFSLGAVVSNIALNFVDKGIAVLIVLIFLALIPKEKKQGIWVSTWKQRPLTDEELLQIKRGSKTVQNRMKRRILLLLTAAFLLLTGILTAITMQQYYFSEKNTYTEEAKKIARFTANQIDGDKIDSYLKNGEDSYGYKETLELLYQIRESYSNIKYLYVLKMERDAAYAVFDLDTQDVGAYELGEKVEYEEAFKPYMDDLLEGNEVPVIESNDTFGWLLTAYSPVKNSSGETVCYVGVDVSLTYLSDFMRGFVVKVIMIFLGFLIMLLFVAIWLTEMEIVYPVNSLVHWASGFMKNGDDQKTIDKGVRSLRKIDIRTGDEIEALYQAICKMATDMSDQVRDIRYYADATAKMQNGLIITMADMVENRDSDTGAHVQKTAAYVRIITESLKRNGYYLEKLTPKYMSDVVMSAPLHDVGKINISDTVLNKPGKLTDEEYEIMKTHTIYGKEIMEKAISTVEGENYLKEARNMAAYHHERWDGKGYPEGLHGEVIPLSARIMAVADVFDALTSPRVYKPAFPLEKALQIMEEGSGTQFDPKCINAFFDALPEVKIVLRKYQDM